MATVALDLSERGERQSHAHAVTAAAPRALPRRLRMVDLLRVSIALLGVGNLGRIPVFAVNVKDVPILFNDFLIVAILGALTIAALRNRSLVLDGPAMFGFVFAGVGAFSAMLAVPRFGLTAFEFLVSIAYLFRWLAYFGVYLAAINFLRPADISAVWRTLEGVILVFAAFGIVQSLFLPGFAQIVFPDQNWDVQGHRLVSTFLDPNFAGEFIVIGLLVMIARMAFGVECRLWKPLLLFAALVLTISRSSLLGFVAGGVVIALVRGHSRRVLGLSILMGLLTLPFLPLIIRFAMDFGRFSVEGSAAVRIVSWLRALEVFADNPILGIGFNTYGFVQGTYGWLPGSGSDFTLDGGLLFVAVMTGLVGVALYSAMILLVLIRCYHIWKDPSRTGEDRGLALGVVAATISLVVHSIFLNSLLYTFLMEVLWVLWALTYVLRRDKEYKQVDGVSRIAKGRRLASLSVLRLKAAR